MDIFLVLKSCFRITDINWTKMKLFDIKIVYFIFKNKQKSNGYVLKLLLEFSIYCIYWYSQIHHTTLLYLIKPAIIVICLLL